MTFHYMQPSPKANNLGLFKTLKDLMPLFGKMDIGMGMGILPVGRLTAKRPLSLAGKLYAQHFPQLGGLYRETVPVQGTGYSGYHYIAPAFDKCTDIIYLTVAEYGYIR